MKIVVAQEGFTPAVFDPHPRVEALLAASTAKITYGGDRAFYHSADDRIQIPEPARFTGTDTMTAAEAFDATRLHEMIHWSGAKSRLDREFGKRFGDQAYAFEELVAELGAAYLCAELGVTPFARADHAQYLAGWLSVMKSDAKAIFTAAGQAQRAASFLMGFAPPTLDPVDDGPREAQAKSASVTGPRRPDVQRESQDSPKQSHRPQTS